NPMATCPCCSDRLLRHIRGHQTIWFCRQCWQPMPEFSTLQPHPSVPYTLSIDQTLQELVLRQTSREMATLN
ncbi:MAG TPA: hypothetical protein ACFE0H_07440, partial [Elainellaceae cyanobacterium]